MKTLLYMILALQVLICLELTATGYDDIKDGAESAVCDIRSLLPLSECTE